MDNNIKNWYEKIDKSLIPKYHNPKFKQHHLKIPFRSLIVGASGSKKTTLIMEIISRMSGTFELIILCCKTSDEPLYNHLKQKVGEQLHVYENGIIPSLNDYKKFPGQMLMIFDDLVNEGKKTQEPIQEWYLRGRKVGNGVSMIYASQSYFKTPKFIRINCNYIFLKKLSSTRDLKMILGDYNLGVNRDQLLELYNYAVDDGGSLLIDIDANSEDRFRKNFLEILEPN